jgi:hypothetical protein
MICGIVVNIWRVTQAGRIVRFLQENNEEYSEGAYPTVAQLRRKCWELTLDDFVLQLGIDTSKFLLSSCYQRALVSVRLHDSTSQNLSLDLSEEDQMIVEWMQFKDKHPWPVKICKLQVF